MIKIDKTSKSILLSCLFVLACALIVSIIFYSDAVTFCSALCDNQNQEYIYKPTQCVCYTPSSNFKYIDSKINEIEEIFINIP